MSLSFDLPILMYHHVACAHEALGSSAFTITRARFARQLDHLSRRGYETITFGQLLAAMNDSARMPRKAVLITFDDGYASFADVVVPELLERNMKATVFLVAASIGGTNEWDAQTGRPLVRLMDAAAIRGVIQAGMEIGVHGLTHHDLRGLEEARVRSDILEARRRIVDLFGVRPIAFCYPFGRYDGRSRRAVAQAGFRMAVSIFSEQRTVTEDPLAMRRIYIHQGDGSLRFAAKLLPAYLRWAAFRQRRMGERCH